MTDVLLPHMFATERQVQRLISAHGADTPLPDLLDPSPVTLDDYTVYCHVSSGVAELAEKMEEAPLPDPADSLVAWLDLDDDGGSDSRSPAADAGSEGSPLADRSDDRVSQGDAQGTSPDPDGEDALSGDRPESLVTPRKGNDSRSDASQTGNPEESGDLSIIRLLGDKPPDEKEEARLRRQAETLADNLRPYIRDAMLAAEGDGDVTDDDECIAVPLTDPATLCRELVSRSFRAARWREREQYADTPRARAALAVLTDTSGSQKTVRELAVPLALQLAQLTWPRRLADWRICHGFNGSCSKEDAAWIQQTAKKHGCLYVLYLGDQDGVGPLNRLASETIHVLALDNGGRVPKNHTLNPIPPRRKDQQVQWFQWR